MLVKPEVDIASAGKVIDKHAVAVSFSRAALSYDGVANIQRWAINELLAKAAAQVQIDSVLDIGCGTGHLMLELAKRFQPDHIIGLDIAEGMVAVANEKLTPNNLPAGVSGQAICGDAEDMPFADQRFSLVASSFALQWCPDLSQVFKEVYRSLKNGGSFYFALPAENTLKELKDCWRQADPTGTHVNDFYSLEELKASAAVSGFKQINIEIRESVEHYDSVKALTAALKAMGAHNVTQGRKRQLTGKNKIKALMQYYEQYRNAQGIPATWDIAFGVLRK